MKKLMLALALVAAVVSCDSAYAMGGRNINEKCDIFGDNREYTFTQIKGMPTHWIGKVKNTKGGRRNPYTPFGTQRPVRQPRTVARDLDNAGSQSLDNVGSQSNEMVEPVVVIAAVPHLPAVNPPFVPAQNNISRRYTDDTRTIDRDYAKITIQQFKRK